MKGLRDGSSNYFKVETFTLDWHKALVNYMSSAPSNVMLSLDDVCAKVDLNHETKLVNQMKVISSIPNYHHWASEKKTGVKMAEFFVMEGNSPRSQLLNNLN